MMKKRIFTACTMSTAALLAVSVSAQTLTEVKIPVRVNTPATVSIQPPNNSPGEGAVKNIAANTWDTLSIKLDGATSVSFEQQKTSAQAMLRRTSQGTQLRLHPQAYSRAAISLYSVNGKRILRGNVSASQGSSSISHKNAAPGVYFLSVNGVNGNSFTSELTHNGGKFNIRITYDAKISIKQVADAAEIWTTTATANGYDTVTYTFTPKHEANFPQDITLTASKPALSPRDSILDYIDKNWQAYGYSSKPTKYAALTFDDGPCPQTGNLLTALQNKKVKATFFVIGQNVRNNQSQARAIHDAGHELANHSDGYDGLGGNTATATITASLSAASNAIKNITGKDVKLFRAPNVAYGANLTSVCTNMGLAIIGVSVWSNDYQSGLSSTQIANNVLNNAADGGIINCHEHNTAPNTTAAIPAMIDGLRQRGYWISTVSELAIIKGKTLNPGTQYDRIQ